MKSNLISKDLWKVIEHLSLRKYLESVILDDEEMSEELTLPPLAKEPTPQEFLKINEQERLKLFLNTMTHSMFKEFQKNVTTTKSSTTVVMEDDTGKSRMKQGNEKELGQKQPFKLNPKIGHSISISTKDLLK